VSDRTSFRVERALLSVTDKTGVVDLARGLAAAGVELLSTGGTAKALREAGIPVVPLEDFTGFPEMLDGRVKTLHPKVHGGILGRRDLDSHQAQMAAHGIPRIDLVVVNLYDFAGAVKRPDATFEDVIEQIDIGGPTLLRSAAKNHAGVLVVVDPEDYGQVLATVEQGQEPGPEARRRLALKVFEHTTRYDAAISTWLASQLDPVDTPPAQVSRVYRRVEALRYGENPHQSAAFYRDAHGAPSFLAAAEKLQGKALSYNNLLDLDAALGLAIDLGAIRDDVSCVYIKHNNPCGAASAGSVAEAIARAREVDSLSAFGAVVAVNRPLDKAAAEVFTDSFVEAIIAPGYDEDALELMAKKKNVRVLRLPDPECWRIPSAVRYELRQVRGGALLQSADSGPGFPDEIGKAQTVSTPGPQRRRAPRPGLRVDGGQARPLQRHRVRPGGPGGGGGRGPDEPRRLGEDLPAEGRGGAGGLRGGLRRLLPVP
jgi:phosphoribosylaminoimidazolecarboxamide formyltransferase/IMP cyclohydrolase